LLGANYQPTNNQPVPYRSVSTKHPKQNIVITKNTKKHARKLLTYAQTKPNKTKAWFRGLLCHPETDWVYSTGLAWDNIEQNVHSAKLLLCSRQSFTLQVISDCISTISSRQIVLV